MNKEISIKKFLIILGSLALLELLIFLVIVPLINKHQELKDVAKYCPTSVCSEDNKTCYNYALNGNKTSIIWRGDCSEYYNN